MKAGVIGKVESHDESLTDFSTSINVDDEIFDQFSQCLKITEDVRLPDGRTGKFGQAAIEEPDTREETTIEDGEISTYEQPTKSVKSTHFLYVPGSFVAAANSSGRFVFELISSHTDITVDRIEFDIDSYVESAHTEEINPWKVGFYDCIGKTNNGVIHGEDLLTDSEIESAFQGSKKNQIGLEYTIDGERIKNFVAESGYVEIYQPSDFSTGQYAEFVESELLPHSYKP